MPEHATLDMTFTPQAVTRVARNVARATMRQLNAIAWEDYEEYVPIDSGRLRDTFDTVLRDMQLDLTYGTPTDVEPEGAYYAFWVETGTVHMAGRHYLRALVDELSLYLSEVLADRSRRAGLGEPQPW